MPPPPANHLEPLAGGWSVWRWVVLRAPGFAAEGVGRLAAPEAALAVDALLDLRETAEPAELERRREAVHTLLASEANRTGAALRELAGDDRFKEALAWQNRAALHGSVAALLRRPAGAADSQTRRYERQIALYLQRYCVKNETIGFFGPVGWATVGAGTSPVEVSAGPHLLSKRQVYFERWAIDALAEKLAGERELQIHLAPRRMPTLGWDGVTLTFGAGQSLELPGPYAALFSACDGQSTGRDIARRLAASGGDFSSEEEVLDALAELREKRLVRWGLDVPTSGDAHPERALRSALLEIPACPARESALRRLEALEAARAATARAAGSATAVDQAMGSLEDEFVHLTGLPARRSAGKMYAGRTLVYEECQRGDAVRLGPALLARLAPPLTLVLESARWFSHAIAERYRRALGALHLELRPQSGAPIVELAKLWPRIPPLFPGATGGRSIVSDVAEELAGRWARLLELPHAGRRLEVSAAELRRRAGDLFAAPGPGWPTARYHSPDVLIAARSTEAISRGEYLPVLGELHVGLNTVLSPIFLKEHPEPEALVRAREQDLPDPCIAPVWSRERSRADVSSPARHDIDLEDGEVRSDRPRSNVVRFADLVVEATGNGQLVVRTRDGSRAFDIISFLEQHLIAEAHGRFALLPPAPHTPRVTVDGVVISRERWRFRGEEIPVGSGSWQERFIAVRGWARAHGLPRFVMIKVPEETKPLYLDFMSPLYVDIFTRWVPKAAEVTVTEMLPAPDELWLVDGTGRRYTSELRFAAVDPEPWRAP